MKITNITIFIVALCAMSLTAYSQSFGEVASATLDAAREAREQSAAPENIRTIFTKAMTAKENGSVNFCGFYVGMQKDDAISLVNYYGVSPGDWAFEGDPKIYSIHFSLVGVRKIMKGGNSFQELCKGVANRVGDLKFVNDFLEGEQWKYETIDGIVVKIRENKTVGTMNLVKAFTMEDSTGRIKNREESEAARIIREKKEAELLNRNSRLLPLFPNLISSMVAIPGRNFKMGKTEVTQMLWEAIMEDNPASVRFLGKDNPVEKVSWDDCQVFLTKINELPAVKESGLVFRLPTEEEWEYACRAGASNGYCKLDDGTEISEDTASKVAWFASNSDKRTHPVGEKTPNAFGLYDMHGNVWEWTSTAFGTCRVLRGGGWNDSAQNCGTLARNGSSPSSRFHDLGFRLCADAVSK